MSPPFCRLIDTGPLTAAENMAIDEALLSCFDPKTSTPVLRLYGWSPPALSLGRFQQAEFGQEFGHILNTLDKLAG